VLFFGGRKDGSTTRVAVFAAGKEGLGMGSSGILKQAADDGMGGAQVSAHESEIEEKQGGQRKNRIGNPH
jgi:hypothetical protein